MKTLYSNTYQITPRYPFSPDPCIGYKIYLQHSCFAPFELRKRFCRIDKLWEYQNGFLGILTATAIFWSCTYYIKKSRFKYVLNKSCYINNIWIQWGNKYSISACCIMVGLWSWFRINEHTLFKISWFLFCNEGYQKYVRYFNMPICEYFEQTTI